MTPDDLKQILGEHVPHVLVSHKWWAECLAPNCDWSESGDSDVYDGIEAHRAHLAAVLHRHVAAAQSEALREAADALFAEDAAGQASRTAGRWLRDRADRLSPGDEDGGGE